MKKEIGKVPPYISLLLDCLSQVVKLRSHRLSIHLYFNQPLHQCHTIARQ